MLIKHDITLFGVDVEAIEIYLDLRILRNIIVRNEVKEAVGVLNALLHFIALEV